MSDAAVYGFLSVARRGLAAMIPASGAPAGARVGVPVTLSVAGSAVAPPMLALRGPGDIAGFDPGTVRRTWPASADANAEPNYFPLIEFNDADLPWRYTPDATAGDRLAPWLCLVVAEESEVGGEVASGQGRPLPVVTLNGSALPDLSQGWAWAHAQVVGGPDAPAADFDAAAIRVLLNQRSPRLFSRLLSPRQLKPLTSYRVFLVPAYERGRLAGLGQAVTGIDRLAPAWHVGQASVTLPVYYSWSFQTGESGDFASLVANLRAIGDIPKEVWQRNLAVSVPGAAPPVWQVVDLESALVPLSTTIPSWAGADAHGFTAALAARTNIPGTKLAPPLYGRWFAAASTLSTEPAAMPPWFHEVNADPRMRVAAGLGTTVVQGEQQQLLAGAWAQVAGIRAANETLRLSQLARELALRIYTRHFTPLSGDALLQISAPLHARIQAGTMTVAAHLSASAIAAGALAPTWRRAARPLGTLAIRQARPSTGAPTATAISRMNTGELTLAPSPTAPAPGPVHRLGDLAAVFATAHIAPDKLATSAAPPGFVVKRVTAIGPIATPPSVSPAAPAPPAAPATPATPPVAPAAPAGHDPAHGPVSLSPPTAAQQAEAKTFITAASALMAQLAKPPAPGTTWAEADLGAVSTTLKTGLDPRATIEAPLARRLTAPAPGPRRTDPLEPVMAAPDFPQPMYEPLTTMAREWLLPGLDAMPADVVALFATNWKFVESFLVGLNHEFARKLLWNGYPTDQRGTYFRHFWDIRSRLDGNADGDIGPIHTWKASLGANQTSSVDPLIVLVRGELIRRYPNVVVYAAQGVSDHGGRKPGTTELQPIFFGQVEPDVALFAFELDRAAARGDPGWFFVLQEHPSEPRFGLAVSSGAYGSVPASWQALGWDHLAASADQLGSLRYIDLTASLPHDPSTPDPTGAVWRADGTPPSRSADLAHITLREPKRLAVHGSKLIHNPGGGR